MKIFRFPAALFIVLSLFPNVLSAAEKSPSSSRIDPAALTVLRRMSATLAKTRAFTYKSRSIIEVPARTGQFITLFSTGDVALRRPNKLRAFLKGDAPQFDFYYDGATVSAFAPATGRYSTAPAPPTIDEMLPDLERETGIRFVTAPLLYRNPYDVFTRRLTSAMVVGTARVHNTVCEHLAFRSPGVNWEIWIESGPRALPRRLAVTFTDRPNYPRTLVEFSHWNLNPWLNAGDFVFRKPAGAEEISFLSVLKSTGRR